MTTPTNLKAGELPTQQDLVFELACKIEVTFDINYWNDGERSPVNAYEIESQISHMLSEMGYELTPIRK